MTDQAKSTDRTKELKVKIPSEQHVKLQSLKILAGKNISDAVTEAIAMYLDEHEGDVGELEDATEGSNGSGTAEA